MREPYNSVLVGAFSVTLLLLNWRDGLAQKIIPMINYQWDLGGIFRLMKKFILQMNYWTFILNRPWMIF